MGEVVLLIGLILQHLYSKRRNKISKKKRDDLAKKIFSERIGELKTKTLKDKTEKIWMDYTVFDKHLNSLFDLYFTSVCMDMIKKWNCLEPGDVVYEYHRAIKYAIKKFDPERKKSNIHSLIWKKTNGRCNDFNRRKIIVDEKDIIRGAAELERMTDLKFEQMESECY